MAFTSENQPSTPSYDDDYEYEEEYILLDLGHAAASRKSLVEGNFLLTGLNTLNPVLHLANGIKLVGDYEETVGTILLVESKEVPSDKAPKRDGVGKPASLMTEEEEDSIAGEDTQPPANVLGKTNVKLAFRPYEMLQHGRKSGA